MKKQYVITSQSNNQKVYFLADYGIFSGIHKTYYTNKKAIKNDLQYAQKCASTQEILDNLKIEEY